MTNPRFLLAIAAVTLLAWLTPAHASADFIDLGGNAAQQFLIGNSIVDPDPQAAGDIEFVNSIGETINNYCAFGPRDLAAESSMHVLAIKNASGAKPTPGAVIGYYMTSIDAKTAVRHKPDPKTDRTIVAGNATHCASVGKRQTATPLILSADQQKLLVSKPRVATPGAIVAKLLAGNTIEWPPVKGESCNKTTYFTPDGHLFSYECVAKGGLISALEQASHWRIVKGAFCIDGLAPDEDSAGSCNVVVLEAVSAANGEVHLQARMINSWSAAGDIASNRQPKGIVVNDNPVNFVIPNRR